MAHTTLIYEPDTPSDARTYADGLARALPALPLIVTSDAAEAVSRAPEASVLVVKAQHASARLIAAMPRLEWIQALTTGVDPLLRLALPPGTIVTTVRGIHGPQMAELTLLLMMTLYRDFPRMLRNQRAARWERWGQRLLAGRSVVIVGVGAISEHLAPLCKAFACSCFANSTIRSGSSVESRTISTGNCPPPGSAGGITGNISMPGMVPSFACTCGSNSKAVSFR